MKVATLIALSVTGAIAETSTTCLNCKLKDSSSSFLYTYSYCKQTDTCLQDEWNYINQWCTTTWIPGWQVDVDNDCEAQDVVGACMPFVTSEGIDSSTRQVSLPEGGQCSVTVDATDAMGRITFQKAVNLGVLYNAYLINEPITIPKGEIQAITIYNGKEYGPLAIDIVTSGAKALGGAVIAFSAVAATLF